MGDTSEQVVALLNTAQVSTTAEGKVQALKRVEELTVNLQPQLLDNFFDASCPEPPVLLLLLVTFVPLSPHCFAKL